MSSVLHAIGDRITEGPTLAFLLLTLALIIGPKVAERLRLPAMVGLVLAGMAIGPRGAGLLQTDRIALSALGDFGLLYLMFAAGLELDLKRFLGMKKAALTFATLSFVIPFSLGLVSAHFLGYAWAAAVLMGSNWGSHTLVTYPILRRMGLARNTAVGTVVGATAVTDTSALLVLAGVSASVSKSSSFAAELIEIAVGLVALGLFTLRLLPWLARWFFARVGTERAYRLVFCLAGFLGGAVLAEAADIDGIVGAFFAGLGLNRAIPERSDLMDRVQFTGAALFIPIFLLSVGVLLDPRVMIDPRTLGFALVFTVAVLGGKALAAVLAGRAFHLTGPEIGVMAGLSGSQAAATLATTLVGAKLGLFDTTTINAVLVVILASLVVTPALVSYFGKKVTGATATQEALGSAVLVPVLGESTRPLLAVAGRLAAEDAGVVVAASVAIEDAAEEELQAQRALKDQADEWLARQGLESRSIFRVSRSREMGVLQAIRSERASLVVAEWHLEGLDPNSDAAQLLSRSPVPILLARGAVEPFERLLLVVRRHDLVSPGARDLETAAEIARRLIGGHQHLGYVGAVAPSIDALFAPKVQVDRVVSADPLAWVQENPRDGDLLLFCGLDAAREALARIPGLDQRRYLVAIAAHEEAFQPHVEQRAGLAVVGRSLTDLPAT